MGPTVANCPAAHSDTGRHAPSLNDGEKVSIGHGAHERSVVDESAWTTPQPGAHTAAAVHAKLPALFLIDDS